MEGQLMGVHDGWSSPNFGWDKFTPGTFYKDPNGYVYIASAFNNGYMMSTNLQPSTYGWLSFFSPAAIQSQGFTKNTCSFGADKTLTCQQWSLKSLVVAPRKFWFSITDDRSGT